MTSNNTPRCDALAREHTRGGINAKDGPGVVQGWIALAQKLERELAAVTVALNACTDGVGAAAVLEAAGANRVDTRPKSAGSAYADRLFGILWQADALLMRVEHKDMDHPGVFGNDWTPEQGAFMDDAEEIRREIYAAVNDRPVEVSERTSTGEAMSLWDDPCWDGDAREYRDALDECGTCAGEGYVELQDHPELWQEDCFVEENRLVRCPDCKRRRASTSNMGNPK